MQFSIKSRIFPKYPEMAKKAIVEANVTYNMCDISEYAWDLKVAQNSNRLVSV